MRIFKTFKFTWWQAGLLKISTISFGIILGLYFRDFFANFVPVLWVLAIISGAYIAYIYFKQK
jgi:hypothetical protein